jgi:hypothetical protein
VRQPDRLQVPGSGFGVLGQAINVKQMLRLRVGSRLGVRVRVEGEGF